MTRLTIAPALPEKRAEAFHLAFRYLPSADRDLRVDAALKLIDLGEIDPKGLIAAESDNHVVGAMLCQPMPGSAALVWPPSTVRPLQLDTEDKLVEFACDWLQESKIKLAQSLLPPEEAHHGASLQRNGFDRVTTLWYLRCPVTTKPPRDAGKLTFQPYAEDLPTFCETLQRTYVGTRDCPEISGIRTIDEIMACHRSQGGSEPQCWWLARSEGQPVGVLFLCHMPEWDSIDVSYMGIVPEARRQGLGGGLLLKAIMEARRAGIDYLTISVDGRNQPAWNLYERMGFQSFDQREVFLAIWA